MSTANLTREQLAQYILNTAKESSLSKIRSIILTDANENESADFFDALPKEVQDILMESRKDIKNGKFYTHEEVMAKVRKKYNIAG